MRWVRRVFTRFVQRWNRNFNVEYLELAYQSNFFAMCERTPWLSRLPISSPRGGTANYSFLGCLLQILVTHEPSSILEIGVGQSTKLLTSFKRAHPDCHLVLVDNDETWLNSVSDDVGALQEMRPLVESKTEGRALRWYGGLPPKGRFEIILVDGPESWRRKDVFNRLGFLNWVDSVCAEEFLIVIDDTERPGESMLARRIKQSFEQQGRELWLREIVGMSSQTLVGTARFRRWQYL